MERHFQRFACFVTAASIASILAPQVGAEVNLTVPLTIINYTASDGNITANSPSLFLPVTFDNDGEITTYANAQFQLSTVGMAGFGDDATGRQWVEASSPGLISVVDNSTATPLLTGELLALSLDALPGTGFISGTGSFAVTGGSLSSQFGIDGILQTLALSFQWPVNFDKSFTAFAYMELGASSPPGDTAAIPERSSLVVWLAIVLILGTCVPSFVRHGFR